MLTLLLVIGCTLGPLAMAFCIVWLGVRLGIAHRRWVLDREARHQLGPWGLGRPRSGSPPNVRGEA